MGSIYGDALSDAELIAEVRNGNDEACGELFRRHHDAALAFAVRLAGATLAPDLVSDSFAKLFAEEPQEIMQMAYIAHMKGILGKSPRVDYTPNSATGDEMRLSEMTPAGDSATPTVAQ